MSPINARDKVIWDKFTEGKSPNLKPVDDYYIENELPWTITVRPSERELRYEIEDKYIAFSPYPFKPTQVSVSDTVITFAGLLGNSQDIELHSSRRGFKKLIRIDNLKDLGIKRNQTTVSYTFKVDTNIPIPLGTPITEPIGIAPNIQAEVAQVWDSTIREEYLDETDEENPVWVDTENKIVANAYFHEDAGQLYFTKEIPVSWLETAIFPVFTDLDITWGTADDFNATATAYPQCFEIATNKFAVVFAEYSGITYVGRAIVGSVSGTTITYGAISTFCADVFYNLSGCKAATDKIFVAYPDDAQGDDGYCRAVTVSGETIGTWGTAVEFSTGDVEWCSCCYLAEDKVAIVYNDEGAGDLGSICICTVSGTNITDGDEVTFEGQINIPACCKLDTDKLVAVYADSGDSSKGKACVFTVVGTVPTPGTPQEFETHSVAASTYRLGVGQLDTDKFVVCWNDGADTQGETRYGSVSTTTITWGTAQTFNTDTSNFARLAVIDSTHYVIVYEDVGNSEYGTSCYVTVTGTNVSPGNEEVWASHQVAYTSIAHIGSGKVAVAYQDDADANNKGEVIIGDAPFGAAEQELTANVVSVTSSVITSTISGSGDAPLTAVAVAETSSVVTATIVGTGTAPLTGTVVSVVSSVQTAIVWTSVSILTASTISVSSSVQTANIAGLGTAPLTGTVISVATSVQVAIVNTTQILTAAVISVTSSISASTIAGSGDAPLTAAVVSVASSIQGSTLVGTGTAPLIGTVVAITSSVAQASVGFILQSSPVAVASSVSIASVTGSGDAPLTGAIAGAVSSVANATLAATGNAPLTGTIVNVTSSVATASIAGLGTAPITGTVVSVTSSVAQASISGLGTAPLTGTIINVLASVVASSIAGSGNAPLTGATIAVTSSIQRAVIAGAGVANLTASPIAAVSSVVNGQAITLWLALFASPLAVVSSVVGSNVALSWILVCEDLGIDPSIIEATRVPISRLEPTRVTSSRQPLCRPERRYT